MQTVLTDAPTMSYNSVPASIHLLSSTKDSLRVAWSLEDDAFKSSLAGYKLKYTADGSHVVQYVHKITPRQTDYDIRNLHEDTQYSICLQMYPDLAKPPVGERCLTVSTATDSLSVALGSTFGAFIALGVIIMFVFIAKWQHTQRIRKRMSIAEQNQKQAHAFEYVERGEDADLETSGLSMQVNEDTVKCSEIDSVDSQLSVYQLDDDNILPNGVIIAASLPNCSECSDHLSCSNQQTNSTECCLCAHGSDCCHGNCPVTAVDLCDQHLSSEGSSPHVKRSPRRGYLVRQKSIESHPWRLGYQYSLDSYDSSCRGSLPRQYSQDSSRYSSCSHSQPLIKQKSQDSAYQYQKYLAPTADGTYDNVYTLPSCQGTQISGLHGSTDSASKPHYSCGLLHKPQAQPSKLNNENNNKHLANHNGNGGKSLDVRPKEQSVAQKQFATNRSASLNTPTNVPHSSSGSHNAQTKNGSHSSSTYRVSTDQVHNTQQTNGQLVGMMRTNNSCPSW